ACQTQYNASLLSLDHPLAYEHLFVGSNTQAFKTWLDFTYGFNDKYQCDWTKECHKEARRLYWPNGRPLIQVDLWATSVTSNPSAPYFSITHARGIAQTTDVASGQAICQRECFSKPEPCPADHPFATDRGQQCSKYYERLIGGTCEEGFLELTDPVECCISCIPCPVADRPCTNAKSAKDYCPTVPGAKRSTDHVGFLVANVSDSSLGLWDAQSFCISNHTGHLPFIKLEQDLYSLASLFSTSTKMWLGATGPTEHACNRLCNPLEKYTYWDGTTFPTDLMLRFGLVTRATSISIQTDVAMPYNSILAKNKNPMDAIACEISCSYYEGVICPMDHPFAFNRGESCCSQFTTTCPGTFLSHSNGPECCQTNVSCQDSTKKCQNHPNFMRLCPQFPESFRFGTKSFQVIDGGNKSTYAEARSKCESLGGILPIVKEVEVYEELTYLIKYHECKLNFVHRVIPRKPQ
ncbi:hypothetical protein TCAL_08061, partial [Tigriopus californicus]